jgi:hypothetical protein
MARQPVAGFSVGVDQAALLKLAAVYAAAVKVVVHGSPRDDGDYIVRAKYWLELQHAVRTYEEAKP